MMKIVAQAGKPGLATVFIGEMEDGRTVEFVESCQPPIPRDRKWVLIISTMFGCPVHCRICDAGGGYRGKLTAGQIYAQIEHLIGLRFSCRSIPIEKFKIQFSRMGEPSLNPAVLEVLETFPEHYDAPGFVPSVSTTAPLGTGDFFARLRGIKERLYQGRFQLQFSLHTTDPALRDWLVPVKKWSFREISEYGRSFVAPGDKKITLNFALAEDSPVEVAVLREFFEPERYLLKFTPVNPTYEAQQNGIRSFIVPGRRNYALLDELRCAGYEVLLSIGEWEENQIGSNCGQYVGKHQRAAAAMASGYTYPVEKVITQ